MEALPKLILLVIGFASVLIATTPADAAKTNKHRHAQTNAVVAIRGIAAPTYFPSGRSITGPITSATIRIRSSG